jgi:hypothetical protein
MVYWLLSEDTLLGKSSYVTVSDGFPAWSLKVQLRQSPTLGQELPQHSPQFFYQWDWKKQCSCPQHSVLASHAAERGSLLGKKQWESWPAKPSKQAMFAYDQISTDWEESGQTPRNLLVAGDWFAESQLPHIPSCLFLFPLGLTRDRTCLPCFSSVPATDTLLGFKSPKGEER